MSEVGCQKSLNFENFFIYLRLFEHACPTTILFIFYGQAGMISKVPLFVRNDRSGWEK